MYDYIKINHNKAFLSDLKNISLVFLQFPESLQANLVRVHRSCRMIFVKVRRSIHQTVTPDLCYCFQSTGKLNVLFCSKGGPDSFGISVRKA